MKICMVHPQPFPPSSRIRLLKMSPYLASLGVDCTLLPYPKNLLELYTFVKKSSRYDLIVLQKKPLSLRDYLFWKFVKTPVVFDFDDSIMLRKDLKFGSYTSSTRLAKFNRALKVSSAFSCGNSYLASFVKETGKPTFIMPTAVPLNVPQHDYQKENRVIQIGWVGMVANLGELYPLYPMLEKLSKERCFELTVVSDRPLENPPFQCRFVQWKLETQEREIAKFDIGLMPLKDNPFNRGKCAYKMLQYMAASVPAVASSCGMNAQVIQQGVNGLLADSPEEWTKALKKLIDDRAYREEIGRAGRQTVEVDYGYEKLADEWASFLQHLHEVNKVKREFECNFP